MPAVAGTAMLRCSRPHQHKRTRPTGTPAECFHGGAETRRVERSPAVKNAGSCARAPSYVALSRRLSLSDPSVGPVVTTTPSNAVAACSRPRDGPFLVRRVPWALRPKC